MTPGTGFHLEKRKQNETFLIRKNHNTKYVLLLLIILFNILTSTAQVQLTFLSHDQLTPNSEDTTGVFCRTFYHPVRDKYYTVYAGRPNSANNQQFSWHEYDADFNPTGNHGVLSGFAGNVGDFAMLMIGTNYYHVTGAPASWSYKLSKYDENFNLLSSVVFPIDSSDSKADMMLNYTNGKLIIGAFHQSGVLHPTMPLQDTSWQPVMHKWEYDTSLTPLASPVYLNEIFTPWGSSCIYANNRYNIVTFDKWKGPTNPNFNLNVYQYDNNWNFIDSIPLNNDGQWSQGLLWDGTYFYLSYHSGHTHQAGNITLAIYDANWNLVYDTVITNYSNFVQFSSPPLFTTDYNANRPYLTRVNDTLIVSYDVDDYQLQNWGGFYLHGNRWQAHVMKFKIDFNTGFNHDPSEISSVVYPNPAYSGFTLKLENHSRKKIFLKIFNTQGQLVYHAEDVVTDYFFLDCANWKNGMYFYQVQSDRGNSTGKFIVISDIAE